MTHEPSRPGPTGGTGWRSVMRWPVMRSRAVSAGMLTLLILGGVGGALLLGAGGQPAGRPQRPALALREPRVVVIKHERQLHLFDGATLMRSYACDLGESPVGQKQRAGDGRTPVGRFRIVTKNAESRYHRFLGLSYPDEEAVTRGEAGGLISAGEAAKLRAALSEGRCPDWSTALGGGIGIHGRRRGRDWTGGCIAVSDEHVEELFAVLRVGDPVEILP